MPSHTSVSFFEIHLPVRVWKSEQATDNRIHHTQQNQEFILSDQPLDRLEFDPNSWLIAKVDKITSADPEMIVPEIRILPDLAQQKIRIVLPELKGNETVQLFDGAGKMVMTKKLKSTDSLIDAGSLISGLYLVKVQSGQTQKIGKMVVN